MLTTIHRLLSSGTTHSITPRIEARLQSIIDRSDYLLSRLQAEQLVPVEFAKFNKELSHLEPIVTAINRLNDAKREIKDLYSLVKTEGEREMKEYATKEYDRLIRQVPKIEEDLLLLLLPRDETDERGVILEIRAGTGGEEASLFALELFRMYERYCLMKGWRWEVVELTESDLGGLKAGSAAVNGVGAYGRLRFESGVHRVQRVPSTETSGRVHTSAASVAVLPQAEEVDVDVREEDLRIDVYRSGGAGGQHVNTTNSAVRITHIPSGLVVAIQDERSQHKNKAKALKILRARLYEAERLRQASEQFKKRKALLGTGDRSDRVRTYNFPQGRTTDHRIGVTEHGMEGVLGGERLDVFIDALRLAYQSELLATLQDDE